MRDSFGSRLKSSAATNGALQYNAVSALLASAVYPFLPLAFTANKYAFAAVTAWFALGNIGLQLIKDRVIWDKTKEG